MGSHHELLSSLWARRYLPFLQEPASLLPLQMGLRISTRVIISKPSSTLISRTLERWGLSCEPVYFSGSSRRIHNMSVPSLPQLPCLCLGGIVALAMVSESIMTQVLPTFCRRSNEIGDCSNERAAKESAYLSRTLYKFTFIDASFSGYTDNGSTTHTAT